jgi:hypothetical protein
MTLKRRLGKLEEQQRRQGDVVLASRPNWLERVAAIHSERTPAGRQPTRFTAEPGDPPAGMDPDRLVYVEPGRYPVEPGWHDVDALAARPTVAAVLVHDRGGPWIYENGHKRIIRMHQ